jgi:hypothetical protein
MMLASKQWMEESGYGSQVIVRKKSYQERDKKER